MTEPIEDPGAEEIAMWHRTLATLAEIEDDHEREVLKADLTEMSEV